MLSNIQSLLVRYGTNFLNGLGQTLLLALISVGFGCLIGAVVAIMRLSRSKVLQTIAAAYTEVIRDTPLLLQLYFFYFMLPNILPQLKLSKFTCIAVALLINSGAYMAEVFRSGIQSIDRGQTEAARSLGLSAQQTMHHPAAGLQERSARHVQRICGRDQGNLPGFHLLCRRPHDPVPGHLRQNLHGPGAAHHHRHHLFCADLHHEQAGCRT